MGCGQIDSLGALHDFFLGYYQQTRTREQKRRLLTLIDELMNEGIMIRAISRDMRRKLIVIRVIDTQFSWGPPDSTDMWSISASSISSISFDGIARKIPLQHIFQVRLKDDSCATFQAASQRQRDALFRALKVALHIS